VKRKDLDLRRRRSLAELDRLMRERVSLAPAPVPVPLHKMAAARGQAGIMVPVTLAGPATATRED
jgi:hypothetical protein